MQQQGRHMPRDLRPAHRLRALPISHSRWTCGGLHPGSPVNCACSCAWALGVGLAQLPLQCMPGGSRERWGWAGCTCAQQGSAVPGQGRRTYYVVARGVVLGVEHCGAEVRFVVCHGVLEWGPWAGWSGEWHGGGLSKGGIWKKGGSPCGREPSKAAARRTHTRAHTHLEPELLPACIRRVRKGEDIVALPPLVAPRPCLAPLTLLRRNLLDLDCVLHGIGCSRKAEAPCVTCCCPSVRAAWSARLQVHSPGPLAHCWWLDMSGDAVETGGWTWAGMQ